MKLLLDSHILLWWLDNNPLLSPTARKLIADPNNTIFLSAVTLWELWLMQSIGKLSLPENFEEGWPKKISNLYRCLQLMQGWSLRCRGIIATRLIAC